LTCKTPLSQYYLSRTDYNRIAFQPVKSALYNTEFIKAIGEQVRSTDAPFIRPVNGQPLPDRMLY